MLLSMHVLDHSEKIIYESSTSLWSINARVLKYGLIGVNQNTQAESRSQKWLSIISRLWS